MSSIPKLPGHPSGDLFGRAHWANPEALPRTTLRVGPAFDDVPYLDSFNITGAVNAMMAAPEGTTFRYAPVNIGVIDLVPVPEDGILKLIVDEHITHNKGRGPLNDASSPEAFAAKIAEMDREGYIYADGPATAFRPMEYSAIELTRDAWYAKKSHKGSELAGMTSVVFSGDHSRIEATDRIPRYFDHQLQIGKPYVSGRDKLLKIVHAEVIYPD